MTGASRLEQGIIAGSAGFQTGIIDDGAKLDTDQRLAYRISVLRWTVLGAVIMESFESLAIAGSIWR